MSTKCRWISGWLMWSALLAGGAPSLCAQTSHQTLQWDSIRGWGVMPWDTESERLRIVDIDTKFYGGCTAVLRSDGRCFVRGTPVGFVPDVPPGVFTRVSVGAGIAVGLRPDGTAVAWGSFTQGPYAYVLPALPAGLIYVDVALGSQHGILLHSDGSAAGFGQTFYGQLNIPVPPPGVTFVRVRAEYNHSVALLSDGSLVAWGDNAYGQCNVPPAGTGLSYVDMDCGSTHMVAVRSDGSLVAWGSSFVGETTVPPLPPGVTALRCAAGNGFSVAWLSNREFLVWGQDSTTWLSPPPAPAGVSLLQLVAGTEILARWSDGSVTGWGNNPLLQSTVPDPARGKLQPTAADRFAAVSIGGGHALVLRADGTAEGFGKNDDGRCDVPALPRGVRYVQVLAHWQGSLALRDDGQIVTFGLNPAGIYTAPALPAGLRYVQISGKSQHFVALRSDGTAVAWGLNNVGQCNLPPLPAGLHYVDVAAHFLVSLLLRSDGSIVHAGAMAVGQHLIPALPPGLVYTDVEVGVNYAAAIRSDGQAVLWHNAPYNPPLPWGVYYVDATLGEPNLWLRRSDGVVLRGGPGGSQPYFEAPLPEPGTSYLDVDADRENVGGRLGPTCIYVGTTPGCAGSLPASRLVPDETPRIGRTLSVRLFDLPHDIAVLGLGWQPIAPLDLGFLGMPGCDLAVQFAAVAGLVGQGQQAVWQLAIPDQPSLVGTHFYNQALVLDVHAGNGFGAVLSDAMHGVVGYR